MKIEVESLGNQDFFEIRDSLIQQGEKFTKSSLALVKYDQLNYCALGVAGVTACSLKEVREEKRRRRARFLTLDESSFQQCEEYLKLHDMYEDVKREQAFLTAPTWNELSYRVRAWAKLTCLANHTDFPLARMNEIVDLLQKSTKEEFESNPLPEMVANNYIQRIRTLMSKFPKDKLDPRFREQLSTITEDLTLSFSESDHRVCERDLISDYSCTSDCFRVV